MKQPNQLPYIAFEGVGKTNREKVESLIAIEPVLTMIGYKPSELWNNHVVTDYIDSKLGFITLDECIEYHSHNDGCELSFKATEIKQFINYMIKEGHII